MPIFVISRTITKRKDKLGWEFEYALYTQEQKQKREIKDLLTPINLDVLILCETSSEEEVGCSFWKQLRL